MKKLLTLLFGALIALSLFVTTGNTAKAAKPGDDCGCTGTLEGAEKNKIVADLLKSQEFKDVKQQVLAAGYSFKGVSLVQVAKMQGEQGDVTAVLVPFYTIDGHFIVAGFFNGEFGGARDGVTKDFVIFPPTPAQ